MKNICLLDLNYTLVGNQADTRMLRPFSRRMEAEEYRADLIEAIRDDYVIIVTARPDYQMKQTMANIKRKTGWQPQEWYFNDTNAEPPVFKESALRRFILPRHGAQNGPEGAHYYAVESNPKTRAMYARFGIEAAPYDRFIKSAGMARVPAFDQCSLFGYLNISHQAGRESAPLFYCPNLKGVEAWKPE